MRTATRSRWLRRCRRYTITAGPVDLGFGYSREPDTTAVAAEPVPAGVELYFFTGRTVRRAVA